MPAIQLDGGSEFMVEFETACMGREIAHFVLLPRSPTRNRYVEGVRCTHRSEFWELNDRSLDLPRLPGTSSPENNRTITTGHTKP